MLRWTEEIFAPRRHDYLLVIPVINEGERIRRQLDRIAAVAPDIDIVIADGGSTDGSLDGSFLRGRGVRALLVNHRPGRLSAQLRMAYEWAMAEGYAGVVTMDGNDKDGVDAIPRFVAALADGQDYVQGSRYLPGGAAINTPLDRRLGGRLLHAPLLSFGAGRWLTDTTNGFRAYSRRYLLDPRVAPLRPSLRNYALLFYLTVRGGALGLRVTEIPVTRAYPDSGKTPTKISGIGGRLTLLGEAVNAAAGGYSPVGGPPQHRLPAARGLATGFVLVMLALLLLFAIGMAGLMRAAPDGWAMYELSRTLTGPFYEVQHRRWFGALTDQSASFPPLWPMILFLIDRLTGAGAASGFYGGLAAFGIFAGMSEVAARRLFDMRWIGLAAAALIATHDGMRDELLGGGTIPLQLALLATMLAVLARGGLTAGRLALLGLLMGLAVMNRFDALPAALALGVGLAVVTRSIGGMAAFATLFGLTISPWVGYSLRTFGTVFATDNRGVALSAEAAFVTDWQPSPPPMLWDAPGAWLARVAVNALRLIPELLLSPGALAAVLWVAALAAPALLIWLARRARPAVRKPRGRPAARRALAIIVLMLLAMLPANIVTGYFDTRYFAALWWVALLLAFAAALAPLRREPRDLFGAWLAAMAVGALGVTLAALVAATPPQVSDFPRDRGDDRLRACLFADGAGAVLMTGDPAEGARLSAIYRWRTTLIPENFGRLDATAQRAFVARFGVTHLLPLDGEQRTMIAEGVPLARDPRCPADVWKIATPSAGAPS